LRALLLDVVGALGLRRNRVVPDERRRGAGVRADRSRRAKLAALAARKDRRAAAVAKKRLKVISRTMRERYRAKE
jgi:hypothetical protein